MSGKHEPEVSARIFQLKLFSLLPENDRNIKGISRSESAKEPTPRQLKARLEPVYASVYVQLSFIYFLLLFILFSLAFFMCADECIN